MASSTSEIGQAVGDDPDAPEHTSTYTLTHDGTGWILLTRRHAGSVPGWVTPLAPHGASPSAPSRVARAVGVRVLHELGVEVAAWIPEPAGVDGEPGAAVALTVAAADPSPRGRLRGLRGH